MHAIDHRALVHRSTVLRLLARRCLGTLLLAGCGSVVVHADEVYKCTDPHGAVAFQDRPCASGEHQQRERLAPVPAATASAEPADAEPAAVAEPPPVPAAPARRSLPALWACLRYDGVQYMSDSGVPRRQAVPLGVLGYPPQGLGQVFGPGGGGAARPGGKVPVSPVGGNTAFAADYVWTEDQCQPATTAQICSYLHRQFDDNHRDLRNAPKTDTPALEQRERELREQLGSC